MSVSSLKSGISFGKGQIPQLMAFTFQADWLLPGDFVSKCAMF